MSGTRYKKGKLSMLKFFNSLQIVSVFAAGPYIIQWLSTATFPAHTAAFWTGIIGYVAMFALMIGCVFSSITRDW